MDDWTRITRRYRSVWKYITIKWHLEWFRWKKEKLLEIARHVWKEVKRKARKDTFKGGESIDRKRNFTFKN